jgi:curved DNA-binding protein CbpA
MPSVKGNAVNRREEHRAAVSLAKEILKDPRLRAILISKHPRLNRTFTEEEKEVFEVTPEQKSIEEDILFYEQAFGASRKAGEDAKELLKIANREEEWRRDDE